MLASDIKKQGYLTPANKTDCYQLVAGFIVDNQNACYRFAYFLVKNEQTAQDILQEAAAKALQSAHKLRDLHAVKAWFYQILVNESRQYFRRQKRLVLTETPRQPAIPDDEGTTDTDILTRIDLLQAINQLEPELRIIITLRFFEDMKLQDVALATNSNENTVKTRLRRALEQLRKLYQK